MQVLIQMRQMCENASTKKGCVCRADWLGERGCVCRADWLSERGLHLGRRVDASEASRVLQLRETFYVEGVGIMVIGAKRRQRGKAGWVTDTVVWGSKRLAHGLQVEHRAPAKFNNK